MDIEFVRTFSQVVDTGSFVCAAKTLHVTQAAVSRRIGALEDYLGCEPLVRNKAGASLTPAGRRFLRYAASMVHALERARHEVGVARSFQGSLTVGGLWTVGRSALALAEHYERRVPRCTDQGSDRVRRGADDGPRRWQP